MSEHYQHVLLAVSGMTPQIITETLYGIHKKAPEKMPTQVIVLTTLPGKERLTNALEGEDNHLEKFCTDYHYDNISLEIHIPELDGKLLEDVRTDREQEVVADFITEQVRKLTQNETLAIHASLAGGRKTMGFTLGYAMSLFGRDQDSLSHVLVNTPFEDVPDFYYPTPTSVLRSDRFKKGRHDLSKAEVTLGEIPLVLMREDLPSDLIKMENVSYTEVVKRANKAKLLTSEQISVTLDRDKKVIYCNDEMVQLKDEQYAFYAMFAKDSQDFPKEGIEPVNPNISTGELVERLKKWIWCSLPSVKQEEYRKSSLMDLYEDCDDLDVFKKGTTVLGMLGYKEIKGSDPQDIKGIREIVISHEVEQNRELMMKAQKFLWDRLLRETNATIKQTLGKKIASYYLIDTVNKDLSGGKRPTQYKGLKILPDNIDFLS